MGYCYIHRSTSIAICPVFRYRNTAILWERNLNASPHYDKVSDGVNLFFLRLKLSFHRMQKTA
jgi:hypothetical protein